MAKELPQHDNKGKGDGQATGPDMLQGADTLAAGQFKTMKTNKKFHAGPSMPSNRHKTHKYP